jgi:amino acid adenylation domain-containing protein
MNLDQGHMKENVKPVEFDPFAGPEIIRVAPAVEPQLEIWVSCAIGGADASRAYNESVSLLLKGVFDRPAMESALTDLILRHEALRSVFSADGHQICVYREVALNLVYADLSSETETGQQSFIKEFSSSDAATAFDLLNGPLFRFALFKLGDQAYYLTLTAHHIICDGWSIGIMLQDLSKFYSARIQNVPSVLPDAIPFSRYAEEQWSFSQTKEYADIEQYWIDQYKDQVPQLEMPIDFPRPSVRTYKSRRDDYPMDPTLVGAIKKVGAKAGSSLISTLISTFEIFLHRITGQPDIVLGIPAAGQSATGNYALVGHCVNLLPLRSHPRGEMAFIDYLKQRKPQILDDYDHQQFTFGSLLKKLNITRDASRVPLVPLVFNIDMGLDDGVDFAGLTHKLFYNPRQYESFEIFINASGSEQSLLLEWSYNTQLYKPASIRRMMSEFESLIRAVVEDPEIKIKDIPLFSSEMLDARLKKWNATAFDYPKEKSVHQLISETASRYPDQTALRFGDRHLTYQHLNESANQLAALLLEKKVKPGDVIGLAVSRSPEMVIALLAILKSGAAYVPLDPQYPQDRIRFMLEDSSAKILLTSRQFEGRFHTTATELLIEAAWEKDLHYSRKDPEIPVNGKDLAYILYTSGSTGKPKGVMVEHRNLVNLLCSMQNMPGISIRDKLLAVTTISFDIAGLELYLPLITGAVLVLTSDEQSKDGRILLEMLKKESISMIQATPSTYKMMLDAGWETKYDLKILCCGEPMSPDLATRLIPRCRELYNMYGPTETTIYSTGTRIFSGDEMITIGHPIGNTQVYILDDYGNPLAEGVVGEIYLAGDGVARGYLNRPELQEERFVNDPFSEQAGARMYRSGDLGKFLEDGKILCLGRIDQQIKIRGYRIEPGEIEQLLVKQREIKEAVVIAREDKPGDQRLVAYIVPDRSLTVGDVSEELLQSWKKTVKDALPPYMVPNHFVMLEQMPITPNGKIDRKALPKPDQRQSENRVNALPSTDTEKLVAGIWVDLLGLQQVGVDEDFFELGGNSMIAVQVMTRLELKTGLRLPITTLFEASTVKKISLMLSERIISWKSLVSIKAGGNKPPLYIVHGTGLTVLVFHFLAKGLDPDQPVFGLQARGLNGVDEPFDTMEDIAACYISEMLEQNPDGPYNLAGYSFGGIVAFEMAKQLEAMGKQVNMLAIFDTYADNSVHFDDWTIKMSKKFMRQFPKFKFILQSFIKHPGKTFTYQLNFVKSKLNRLLVPTGLVDKKLEEDEHLEHADKINQKHDIAFEKYKMKPYNGTIDLFRVKSRMYYLDDPIYLGWKPFALQGLNIHEISGDHRTFLLSPNVQELSALLRGILSERNRGKEVRDNFPKPVSVLKAI